MLGLAFNHNYRKWADSYLIQLEKNLSTMSSGGVRMCYLYWFSGEDGRIPISCCLMRGREIFS